MVDDPNAQWWPKLVSMITTWVDQMAHAPNPIVEKMVLFWHGLYTSALNKTGNHPWLVDQLALYRGNCFGPLDSLVQAMCVMPEMLDYLDNRENRAKSPNENFGRELLELFVLGVGNYQEADVIAAARAWTGHTIDRPTGRYVFDAATHDTGVKTFLGHTGNWDGPDIIRLTFEDPALRSIAVRYLCTKLWEFFAHPRPPADAVTAMANAMMTSLDIKAALRTMFNLDAFYAPAARNRVRSPIEYAVATVRCLGVDAALVHPEWYLAAMGQEPYNPPNVSGWRHDDYWLSTASTSAKAEFAYHCTWRLEELSRHPFANSTTLTPAQTVQRALDLFELDAPAPSTRQALVDWVIANRAAKQSWAEPTQLLVLLMLTPDVQLT